MNALTVYSKDELAILNELDLMPAGMGNLEAGDVGMPPRLRISQPNRPVTIGGEEVTPGNIVNTMSGESWDSVAIVPIVFLPRTRVMWPKEYNADNAPECVSNDGKLPDLARADVTNPQPGPCATCPMATFPEGGGKPRCSEQRNFLVWLVEAGEPAILTLQSTAIKEARHLTALAKTTGLKKAVKMTTVKVKDSRGSWFVPQFSRGDALPVESIMALAEARDELRNLVINADTEAAGGNGNVHFEEDDLNEMPF